MINCINVYKHRELETREYNIHMGVLFYSNEVACSDLLKSAIATRFNGKPSDFWCTQQDKNFFNFKGFEKTYLELAYEQKTSNEQLFIDLQETFNHYQKGVNTNLYKLNNLYVAANFKRWYSKGNDEAPSELFDLVNAFIYLQNHNHYPEYVKPIIYGYLGSKMLEG